MPQMPAPHPHLTLRSARSARLEGWATTIVRPTLRDAYAHSYALSFRTAPQGEVVAA